MRYHVLATDYDGTIATHGVVGEETLAALDRVRASGRKVVMVSGRELEDLMSVFPRLDLFDLAVLENGALLYWPTTRQTRCLAEPPPPAFAEALRARGVPVSVGRVIVATWQPHETTVLEVIKEMGLELQVIFNKGAVMILPSGVNKALGLRAALECMGLSPHNAVGVGDAENDHAFLHECECAVAVANALPTLKERADVITARDHGAGVEELAHALVETDLAEYASRLSRHEIPVGTVIDRDQPLTLPPYGAPVLVMGTSGAGKSTLAQAVLEAVADKGYQFCVVDPEGDFSALEGVTALGDATHPPVVDEVLELLAKPGVNVGINLLGVSLADRPAYFDSLFPRLQELRARTGRPHWIVIDEAHHVLPDSHRPSALTLSQELNGLMLITIHPEQLNPALIERVDLTLTIGKTPAESMRHFAEKVGIEGPRVETGPLPRGEALAWWRSRRGAPLRVALAEPRAERRRHVRKYAAGDLGPDESFYFRGPEGKLKLRAQNLQIFLQVAEGVDEETWLHHLRNGDYSQWFRDMIKDPELADVAIAIEKDRGLDADASRAKIKEAIDARYTAAA